MLITATMILTLCMNGLCIDRIMPGVSLGHCKLRAEFERQIAPPQGARTEVTCKVEGRNV